MPSNSVKLYVYDISQGMAASLGQQLVGQHVPAIYHTGIAVFNREFFFGGGVQETAEPNPMWTQQPRMQHEIITLGETTKTPAEFRAFVDSIRGRFTPETYNLLTHNCNNFTDECSHFLLGTGIPAHITGQPAELMATPIGAMMRPMIEGFQQNRGGGGMDPFGGVGVGFPTAAAPTANPWATPSAPAAVPPNPWLGVTQQQQQQQQPQPQQEQQQAGSTQVVKLDTPVERVGQGVP